MCTIVNFMYNTSWPKNFKFEIQNSTWFCWVWVWVWLGLGWVWFGLGLVWFGWVWVWLGLVCPSPLFPFFLPTLSPFHSLTLLFCRPFALSPSHRLTLSPSHPFTLSSSRLLPLSSSHLPIPSLYKRLFSLIETHCTCNRLLVWPIILLWCVGIGSLSKSISSNGFWLATSQATLSQAKFYFLASVFCPLSFVLCSLSSVLCRLSSVHYNVLKSRASK